MFKKSLIFFFFSSNFFSFSIDDFLNPDFIFSSDDLICASIEENFAAIKIPSRFEQNQLKNFRITEKIIEKVCTQNIDKQISLDLKIQSELVFILFSYNPRFKGIYLLPQGSFNSIFIKKTLNLRTSYTSVLNKIF